MKKTMITLALASVACLGAMAQENVQDAAAAAAQAIADAPKEKAEAPKPSNWKKSLVLDLGINQTNLSNWAAGGFNTATFNTGLDAGANYAKDLASWDNRLQLQYGFLWSEDKEDVLQRSTDRIYLESKYAYKTNKDSKWSYSAMLDIRSQFSNGYKYNTPSEGQTWSEAATLKSGFLSPGYLNLGLGMDWTPNAWFNMNISPLTGGITAVRIPELRKTYGMELLEEGLDPDLGTNYRSFKFQLGAQIKANLKFNVNDKFAYETQLVLFSDYLDHPLDLRVNWDNKVTWQIAKFFKLGFNTWLIYDPNVLIADEEGLNPTQRIQFKEFTTFSFTWTFGTK